MEQVFYQKIRLFSPFNSDDTLTLSEKAENS